MLSDVTSKNYEDLKREAGGRKRDGHKPATQVRRPKEEEGLQRWPVCFEVVLVVWKCVHGAARAYL